MNDTGETTPSPEAAREGRWLSYTEIARVRGIGRESAVKLAQRERWRRIRGNDGAARVLVPPEWLKPAREPSGEQPPERSPALSHTVTLLEGALTTLREQLERERTRADTAIALIDGFRAERDSATQALAAERARSDALRDRLDQAQDAARYAEEAADELRAANLQRRARGRLARAWSAWRGE